MADKQEDNNNVIIERIAAVEDKKKDKEAPTIQIKQQSTTPIQLLNNTITPETKPLTKKPPDILCNCPQKCDQRVPQEVRSSLYKEFCSLDDHLQQNAYLQSYIEMRSVYKRLWSQEERVGGRLQRRVSCKYKIPMEVSNDRLHTAEMSPTPPKISTNSKGEASIVVGVKEAMRTIEVCQKAFMNVYGITEKRIRLQREKLIARLRADNLHLGGGTVEERNGDAVGANEYNSSPAPPFRHRNHSNGTGTSSSSNIEDDPDQLSIVDTFFRNQLWKPEYIGIPLDKLQYIDIFGSSNNVKA